MNVPIPRTTQLFSTIRRISGKQFFCGEKPTRAINSNSILEKPNKMVVSKMTNPGRVHLARKLS